MRFYYFLIRTSSVIYSLHVLILLLLLLLISTCYCFIFIGKRVSGGSEISLIFTIIIDTARIFVAGNKEMLSKSKQIAIGLKFISILNLNLLICNLY
jgi:hypothetical protein